VLYSTVPGLEDKTPCACFCCIFFKMPMPIIILNSLVSAFGLNRGRTLPILAIWLVHKWWTNSTGRSISAAFLWLSLANAFPCAALTLLRCWWSRSSGNYWTKIGRCIGTSCIIYVPKVEHAILNNKDAPMDSSTRKMKSLHSVGRMRHNLSKTDTTYWCTLRRVSKW
jgi:hypothetical protein